MSKLPVLSSTSLGVKERILQDLSLSPYSTGNCVRIGYPMRMKSVGTRVGSVGTRVGSEGTRVGSAGLREAFQIPTCWYR